MFCDRSFLYCFAVASFLLVITSCASPHYFKTPNDVNKTSGSIFLRDGTEKKGLITILFENGTFLKNSMVHFLATDSSKEELIDINLIAYYVISGNRYYAKYIDLNTAGINHLLFVKQLTEPSSKIQLYELPQKFKGSVTGEETTYYFIALPTSDNFEAIELNSEFLVPNFDSKMSAFVADCPNLAHKIKAKQPGYSYSMLSFGPKKIEVIKRIIREYNDCK